MSQAQKEYRCRFTEKMHNLGGKHGTKTGNPNLVPVWQPTNHKTKQTVSSVSRKKKQTTRAKPEI